MLYRYMTPMALALFPTLAVAQVQTGTTAPSLLIPLEPPEALPASGTAGGYLFNLRPLGDDFGQALADDGIYIIARNLSEEIGDASGGYKRGAFFEGYSSLGLDVDLARVAGLKGAAVHLVVSDLQGEPFAGYSGSAYLNNRIFAGNGPGLHLNEFSYEQSLFDKQVNLRLGRVPACTQFDGSELYCTFITSLCRTPAAYTFDRGYPPYLTSSWAAVAQIRIAGAFYTNVGVYENEPVLSRTNHAGFPGPDWGLNYADGATIPVQLGYRTTVKNDQFPRAFSVGGFYASGRYTDPLSAVGGNNHFQAATGKTRTDDGLSQIYVQAQQMVYRPDSSDRGLTMFGGANWATSGQPNIERMIFAGVFDKGILAARPNDTAGLAISLVGVNPRATERVDNILARSTHGQASRSEISYEVNYGAARARPLVQAFLPVHLPSGPGERRHAQRQRHACHLRGRPAGNRRGASVRTSNPGPLTIRFHHPHRRSRHPMDDAEGGQPYEANRGSGGRRKRDHRQRLDPPACWRPGRFPTRRPSRFSEDDVRHIPPNVFYTREALNPELGRRCRRAQQHG